MELIHKTIDIDLDKEYILERHCRVNYECDSPWKRQMSYEEYRNEWFGLQSQMDIFINALAGSMNEPGTIAEIIENTAGITVAYLWVPFYADKESGFRFAEVQDIYVESEFRNAAIATSLMDYAERKAKENGAKVIRSGTGCRT